MQTKLAVLDVDDTLYEGNVSVDFLKVLIERKIFPENVGSEIISWYKKYKSGDVEKTIVVDECYKLYAQGMKNLSSSQIKTVASETWSVVNVKLFTFVVDLVNLLKSKNYRVVLLSGSAIEMVSEIAKYLKILATDVLAGELEIVDDKYSGQTIFYPGSSDQKLAALNSFISKNNLSIDWGNSIALGDNEREIKIFEKVGHPFAHEPNDVLEKEASQNSWPIVDRNSVLSEITKIL